MVWPLGTWQMSVRNTPVPNPLCIQHRSQLLASQQKVSLKLWILFNGDVSGLSVPLSFVCSSKPKMKTSGASCLLCSAPVPVWWGQGYMWLGTALLAPTSCQQKTDASQMTRVWEPLVQLWDIPWVKSCLAQPLENLADGRWAKEGLSAIAFLAN